MWQTSTSERRVFEISQIQLDGIRKILKFKINGDLNAIDQDLTVFVKLSFRNTIFKGNFLANKGGFLYVSVPEEVQLEELREFPRFSFTLEEEKMATLSMNTNLVRDSKFNLKVKLTDISQQGLGLVVSYSNSDLLKSNEFFLSSLGKHSLDSEILAKIKYHEHFSYRENGKLIKCMKMGAELEKFLSESMIESYIRSVEGFDHSSIGFLGHSHEFESTLHNQMNHMYSSLKRKNDFFSVLKGMDSTPLPHKEDEYFPRHIKLVAQLSCGIAKLIGHDTKKVLQSLIYTSFVHDIAFMANRKLSLIQDMHHFNLVKDALKPEERELYLNAPKHAFDFAFYDKYAPKGVEKVLIQTRELPDGTGYPNKILPNEFHPIAAIFIVAHDMANFVLERRSWNYQEYIYQYNKKFLGGIFDDIGSHLEIARATA